MSNHPFYQRIAQHIQHKKTCLCVGLDPDPTKMPAGFDQTIKGVEAFLKRVIALTTPYAIAFKINIAFYESLGIDGLKMLERVRHDISASMPVIIDAKRGDIGYTSHMQATFIYDYFGADATTLHPYMGEDSLVPFFDYQDKFNFVLTLTSNPSIHDFETLLLENGDPLYMAVAKKCCLWSQHYGNIGMVVGATQLDDVDVIRQLDRNMVFLMPGVGVQNAKAQGVKAQGVKTQGVKTQGADYQEAVKKGKNDDQVVIVNVGRQILYSDDQVDHRNFDQHILKQISCYSG